MEMDANNLNGWAMSQEMPDKKFEWLSFDECRTMEQTLNFAADSIAMFDVGIFDHRVIDEKKSFILEVDLEYSPELHEQNNDYPLLPEVMNIEPEITGKKQHNLQAQYFKGACLFIRKLLCVLFLKKHYLVLGQLFQFDLDRGMRLVTVHRAIRFNSSPHVAGYTANNKGKRKQLKHDNVKKAFYKLMNNAP